MPTIRNLALIKRFTDYFKLKSFDMLDSQAGRMLVPVVNLPVPPNVVQIGDALANDSDKTFTVPAGKQWKLLYGFLTLITTATAGNRQIQFRALDEIGNLIYAQNAVNVQVASTTEFYSLGQFGDVAESSATIHSLPIPVNLILNENQAIQIIETAAVDAAADDMRVRLIIEETDVEDL